jgi:hypothetical protein
MCVSVWCCDSARIKLFMSLNFCDIFMICLLFVMGVGNPWVCYTRWVMGMGKNSPQGGEWGWGRGNFTNAGTGKKRQSPRGGRPVAIPTPPRQFNKYNNAIVTKSTVKKATERKERQARRTGELLDAAWFSPRFIGVFDSPRLHRDRSPSP